MPAFIVPNSQAEAPANRFEFVVPGDDTVYSLPLLKYLPVGVVNAAENAGGDLGKVLAAFGDGPARDAVETLNAEQIEALTAAWGEASGVTLGESGGSPTSSRATRRRLSSTASRSSAAV